MKWLTLRNTRTRVEGALASPCPPMLPASGVPSILPRPGPPSAFPTLTPLSGAVWAASIAQPVDGIEIASARFVSTFQRDGWFI